MARSADDPPRLPDRKRDASYAFIAVKAALILTEGRSTEAQKLAKRIWVVGPDAKHKATALEKRERREIRKAQLFGAAIGLAAAVFVLLAVFAFQHR